MPLFFGWRFASSLSSFLALFDECPDESPTEWSFSRLVGLVGLRPMGVIDGAVGSVEPEPVVEPVPVCEVLIEFPIMELTEIGPAGRVSRLE